MKNYVIYQAYGHLAILHEAAYSILSLLDLGSSRAISIVVYTDQPSFFESLFGGQIICEPVSLSTFQQWRGDIDFVHRVKIEVLTDAAQKYAGNLLYADTDTTFLQSVMPLFERIAQGEFFMHCNEGALLTKANRIFSKTLQFLKGWNTQATTPAPWRIPLDTLMWNAGVLGFSSSHQPLLGQVLEGTDLIYPHFPKHIVEQLAFAYVLQKNGKVTAAEPYIFHYWYFKEFREILGQFFEKHQGADLSELLETYRTIDPVKLSASKKEYLDLPRWKKNLRKLTGQGWKIPPYQL